VKQAQTAHAKQALTKFISTPKALSLEETHEHQPR